LTEIFARPELRSGIPHPRTFFRLFRFLAPTLISALGALVSPVKRRAVHHARAEAVYARFVEQAQAASSLSDVLALHQTMADMAMMTAVRQYVPLFLVGIVSLVLLRRLARDLPGGEALALIATRGLPHNVTTEMDLALWSVATVIQAEGSAAALFASNDPRKLAARYKQATLPPATQGALEEFFLRYGMRAVGEIDVGNPRWRETPEQILQTLQSYLQIDDPQRAPDVVFARGRVEAERALEALAAGLRNTHFGRVKARFVRLAGRRVRELAGYRESPKFLIVRMMGHVREKMLSVSEGYVAAGRLLEASDIFFLHLSELHDLKAGAEPQWRELITERRKVRAQEMLRRRIPTLLLSDGTAYFEGSSSPGADLSGTPVSPGAVEGVVRVIAQPQGAHLNPGEILVCIGTDPAWTPLFLTAGGLITEVGGLMTHGSVVAREYGIPAVVGVREATTRLVDGQRIRLDGSSGQIELLPGKSVESVRTAAPQPTRRPADQLG
jgi:pyruvate,water dikinase